VEVICYLVKIKWTICCSDAL
jgi:hypothetical protein